MLTRTSRVLLLLALVLGSAGCDQWTKYQAVASLTHGLDQVQGASSRLLHYLWETHPEPSKAITVVEGLWRFVYAENPGAAFSFLANAWFGRWFLVAIGVVAVGAFFVWATRLRRPVPLLGASLILGGAIGNLFDRVRLGYVVDFVQWHWQDLYAWPVFNVADVWIFVGGVLVFFSMRSIAQDQRATGHEASA